MDKENPDNSTTNETTSEDAVEREVVDSESNNPLSPPANTPPESFNLPATETPEPQNQPTKRKFLTKKRLLILTGLLILILASALIWLLVSKTSDDSTDEPTINEDGTYNLVDNTGIFLPRYDNTKAYMSYKNQNWYLVDSGVIVIDDNNQLVRYYTHANGIKTGFNTGLLEYKGKVWLSTQDGVQYLDEANDSFVTSYNRIDNGKIYFDETGNGLYLSTFEDGLLKLNDSSNSWEQVADISGLTSFSATKDAIVVTTAGPDEDVVIFDRSAGTWISNKPESLGDFNNSFSVNGELFVMGRSPGYTSCGEAGIEPATNILRFSVSGAWEPVSGFYGNTDIPEYQAFNSILSDAVYFDISTCDSGELKYRYTVNYDGSTLSLTDEQQQPNNGYGNVIEQDEIINTIQTAVKTPPANRVLTVDSDGSVWLASSNTSDSSTFPNLNEINFAPGGDFNNLKSVTSPEGFEPYSTKLPISCIESTGQYVRYIFYGIGVGNETGPNEWEATKIYPVDRANLTIGDGIDLKNDIASANFSCANGNIYWAGATNFKKLNTSTSEITNLDTQISKDGNNLSLLSVTAPNGDMWALDTNYVDLQARSKLYKLNVADEKVSMIADLVSNGILAGSSSSVWLSNTEKSTVSLLNTKGEVITDFNVASSPSQSFATFIDENRSFAMIPKQETNPSENIINQAAFYEVLNDGTVETIPNTSPIRYSYSSVNGFVFDRARNSTWMTDESFGITLISNQ